MLFLFIIFTFEVTMMMMMMESSLQSHATKQKRTNGSDKHGIMLYIVVPNNNKRDDLIAKVSGRMGFQLSGGF